MTRTSRARFVLRLLPFAVCLLPSAFCLSSCGGGRGAEARPRIGVTLLTQTHAFYKALEAGLRSEAAAKNLDLVVVACEMDPAKQASQIEDFVAQHVAAILAAPCDSTAIVSTLGVAERAGIPVFTADIAARGGKIVSHVASDNIQGGQLAAQAMAEFTGGKGEIAIIDQPTVASVQDRVAGFEAGLNQHPEMTVVAKLAADGQRAKATQVMEDLLQAHRHLAGVFGINDDSALAAMSVLESAGRTDVVVIGYDATDEAQAAIKRGSPLKADVIQHPDEIGKTAIDIIARYLAGEQVPAIVPIPVGLVEQKDLQK